MKYIKLVYWNGLNLGDCLSPFIIKELSGLSVKYRSLYTSGRKGQLKLVFNYIKGKLKRKDLLETLFFYEKNLLAVGSILSLGNKKSVVWGSGFMNYNEKFRGGKVFAVRGKLTNNKLIEQGFKGCNVFGDPALLLPLMIPSVKDKIYDIAIIPHWSEVEYFKTTYGNKYKVLDLRTDNIEQFIRELTLCKHILSTSLHGIILSHAYGIPALWIKHGYIDTDGFKFYDYFSSVDIPIYKGISDSDNFLQQGLWEQLFFEFKKFSLPIKNIKLIQKELLKAAPFDLTPKYESILRCNL
ncbi:MAG: polysaccharide pyruvyl transferase family protein [Phocaeicola sp.]|nr:polysaccharide pyruvyl transferase family protein [Phocaeicola sp.]